MAKKRRKNYKKYKRIKNSFLTILFILLLCLSAGLVYYFVFYKNNDSNNTNNNKPTIDKPISDNLYSVNQESGFIIKNYSLIKENVLENPMIDLYENNVYKYIRYSVSDHNPIGLNIAIDNQQSYRIGHWNALNFNMIKNSENSKEQEHAKNIAQVINYFKYDLIGLTEINKDVINESNKNNNDNPAYRFVNLINDLIPINRKEQYHYNIIVSKNTNSAFANSGQSEQVAIIYNEKKLIINNNLNNNDALIGNGIFYSNKPINDKGIQRDYVRAPFASKFKLVDKPEKEFVVSFSHFDSPGSSNTSVDQGTTNGIGNQELFEAQQIDNVLEEFKKEFNSNEIIFMGDTNIKTGKQATAFNMEKLTNLNYKFGFEDNNYYNTSLATETTVSNNLEDELKWYANAYDKIIYHLNDFKPSVTKI